MNRDRLVLHGDHHRQLDQRGVVEVLAQPGDHLVGHGGGRGGHRLGVLQDLALEVGVDVAVPPARARRASFAGSTPSLVADPAAEVDAPRAADRDRRGHLGQVPEVGSSRCQRVERHLEAGVGAQHGRVVPHRGGRVGDGAASGGASTTRRAGRSGVRGGSSGMRAVRVGDVVAAMAEILSVAVPLETGQRRGRDITARPLGSEPPRPWRSSIMPSAAPSGPSADRKRSSTCCSRARDSRVPPPRRGWRRSRARWPAGAARARRSRRRRRRSPGGSSPMRSRVSGGGGHGPPRADLPLDPGTRNAPGSRPGASVAAVAQPAAKDTGSRWP